MLFPRQEHKTPRGGSAEHPEPAKASIYAPITMPPAGFEPATLGLKGGYMQGNCLK